MTQVDLAVLVATDGTRYKLKGWRNGSHRTTPPKRPAQIYMLTPEEGWQHLESWNGAKGGDGMNSPKSDTRVLEEAFERLDVVYGVDIEEVVLKESSGTNHLGHRLGWGHNVSDATGVCGDDVDITRVGD